MRPVVVPFLSLMIVGAPIFEAAAGPLTLEEALAAGDRAPPRTRIAQAERAMALAEQDLVAGRRHWSIGMEVGLRRVQPSAKTSADDAIDDNSVRLYARKPLYDFGRTDAAERAAQFETQARDAGLIAARAALRLEIIERFFDVLLADLEYTVDNEYMAVAYVRFDDDRQRLEVGQISPVDLKEAEARYQRRRAKRNASDQRRRTSRARLAIAMNQPDKLPSELAEPALNWAKAPLPSIEALKDIMARHNPALHEVESLVAASRHRLEAIRAERRPSLDVDLEAAAYTRELNGRDDLRAGVVLTWPLHQGVRVDARLAREDALLRRLEAQRDALRMELEETLLETALEVEYLRGTAIPAAMAEMEFRDLALERARGEYETERKTNLGDSMAATMEAALGLRRAEYRLALAVARIEALIGRPLDRLSVGVSDTGVP